MSGLIFSLKNKFISFANNTRAEGVSPHDAIADAGVRRFRPIMLTTLTTFFGLAPMIFETSLQARIMIPMAISLGYGLVFATLIILVLIPCLYLIIEDIRRLFGLEESRPSKDQIIEKA